MKKATGAILYHCNGFKDDVCHGMCPRDENTWCKFQLNKLRGSNLYKSKINQPVHILKILKFVLKAQEAIPPIAEDEIKFSVTAINQFGLNHFC